MRASLLAILLLPAAARAGHLSGDVRFFELPSKAFGGTRAIAVYLPPGYERSTDRYPVLYAQDGQNLFDASTSFAGKEWGLDETLERLIGSGRIAPVIAVAVYHAADRVAEYSPVSDPEHGGGGADAYGRFLLSEVKPFIDKSYRTVPGDTALLGSSLGGLLALHLALTRPAEIGRVAALSPSLWWAGREIVGRAAASPAPPTRPRVWVDMGTREDDSPERSARDVRDLRDFAAALESKGWRRGVDLRVREIDGARHDETAWGDRLPEVLEFLFPSPLPSTPGGG